MRARRRWHGACHNSTIIAIVGRERWGKPVEHVLPQSEVLSVARYRGAAENGYVRIDLATMKILAYFGFSCGGPSRKIKRCVFLLFARTSELPHIKHRFGQVLE